MVEFTTMEQNKKKRMKINFRVSGKTLNTPTLNYRGLRRGR